MKNHYEILELEEKATLLDIKNSYKRLALINHPDKGGTEEGMKLVIEAYSTLSDPKKRKEYNERLAAYKLFNVKDEDLVIRDYIEAKGIQPFSKQFRDTHEALIIQYENEPLELCSNKENLTLFKSEIYCLEEKESVPQYFDDVFTFIHEKTIREYKELELPAPIKETLSVNIAVKILIDFLAGKYYADNLNELKKYLSAQIIKLLEKKIPQAPALKLYSGIFEIILLTGQNLQQRNYLIFSLKKISDYANEATEAELSILLPLFYNKYYRNLYAYSLHLFWQSDVNLFDLDSIKKFDGQIKAKDFVDALIDRLSGKDNKEGLHDLIRNIKLLYILERDLHESKDDLLSANYYRSKAFHLLDWLPAFRGNANNKMMANLLLQIGIKFQRASLLEKIPNIKIADEKMAIQIYSICTSIVDLDTPDVKMYANILVLKYISALHFQDLRLQEVIPTLQKRTLLIADVFPFFEGPQSNISLFLPENKPIHLMRRLLNSLMAAYEYNKTHKENILIDHSAVTILYQVYEACLKNWYLKEYDSTIEENYRLELMEELLFEKGWTFLDVEQNVASPWIMVDRDRNGWMTPLRSLPYKDDGKFTTYRAINGAEINYKTGNITFYLDDWKDNCPEYEKSFTLFDLQEMLEKNISGAFFSLDPVDPDKPFHPFNTMRFGPSQLCETELFNTMLLTDYILKFLTTNREIQGQYPFKQQSVDKMIEHLPEYLREIIYEYHKKDNTGATHRFWIEAEEINIAVSELKTDDMLRIALGSLKMIVKKHKMVRDIHGELKDSGNDDEGWPIYILTHEQIEELEQKDRMINSHAMIFIYPEMNLIFWENNKIIKRHNPEDFDETLIRLNKQPKDLSGRILQVTNNMPLLYRVTTTMAEQAIQPHRYSPEFIFAHKFTTHYDEFSQYLPEFRRLKELSKFSSLILYLERIRETNKKVIQVLDSLVKTPIPIKNPDSEIYNTFFERYQDICEKVKSRLQILHQHFGTTNLSRKFHEEIMMIKNLSGSFDLNGNSPEVNDRCQTLFEACSKGNPNFPSSRIWSEYIEPKRSEIVEQILTNRKNTCRKLLEKTYSPILAPSLTTYAFEDLINTCILGDNNPLADALTNHTKAQKQNEISKQYPCSATRDIIFALDGSKEAIERVADEDARGELRVIKGNKDVIESGFKNIGMGIEEEKTDPVEGRCFWVPASVRHEVRKVETRGLSQHSIFVYGGVSIQPKVTVVNGNGSTIGGNPVDEAKFNRREVTRGFQNHHIISDSNKRTMSHVLLHLAGFNNLNAQANRIFLPINESLHTTRSIHIGRHTNRSIQVVADRMNRIVEQGRAAGWTQQQYNCELKNMLSIFRQDLREGNIALNKRCRPWAYL